MADQALKKELTAAVKRSIGKFGTPDFEKAAILKPFIGRGVSVATLYRWVDEAIASLRPGARATKVMRAAAVAAAEAPAKMADKIDRALSAVVLPPRLADMGGALLSIEALMEEMQTCVANARDVARHARTDDGKVRMAKTLLAASEHNRRCMETLLKIQEAYRSSGEIDRFMDAIVMGIRDVGTQYPEAGKAMMERLRAITGRWG